MTKYKKKQRKGNVNTMKKLKLLLTVAVIVLSTMICCSVSVSALTEGDWEFQLLDNEVTITGYHGKGENVEIPENIYGCPVTDIDHASCKIKNVKTLTIPGSIKKVPANVFDGSDVLETVIFKEGVEEILGFSGYYGAFGSCKNLKTVELPSTLKVIGNHAFYYCKALKEIKFPAGIELIEICAFQHSGLTNVDLSGISDKAEIEEKAFGWCENLETVKLNNGLKEILSNTFAYCKALKDIEIPNTVTYIGERAFEGCESLKSIILPTSLKDIRNNCFNGSPMEELIIPYGTVSVGFDLFKDNNLLKAIYVPDTVTQMWTSPIENCPNCIIYCTSNSHAAKQCKQNKVSYLTDDSVNSGIHVFYNGKRISFHSYAQNPEILEGRTLVPLRSIFEAMGASVEWDGETSTAIAKRGNVEVEITIGANEIYKNGKAVAVDVAAQLMNNRTMVPARVIAEAFGAEVKWHGNGRVVLITE